MKDLLIAGLKGALKGAIAGLAFVGLMFLLVGCEKQPDCYYHYEYRGGYEYEVETCYYDTYYTETRGEEVLTFQN